jgi:uncharacterized protein (TIGR02391 family)
MATAPWDDIQILQTIDRLQGQTDGRPIMHTGYQLASEVAGVYALEETRLPGFVRELHIGCRADLITFTLSDSDVNPQNASYYLQQVRDIGLTIQGRDRARGRMLAQPLPDSKEDVGGRISNRVFRQIAEAITSEYSPADAADFIGEEGIPPPILELPEGTEAGDVYTILTTLWAWGAEGRRLNRRFIGRWLDDRLDIGPDPELRARLIEQLARQGWRVRMDDSILVAEEPLRGIPITAPFPRASRLHPAIEAEARPQFLIAKPDQGVFAAMKAVEVRVRKLAGLGDDYVGVRLMTNAFGTNGQLTDPSMPTGEQEGTRELFAGAFAVLRNPAGHREVDYGDMSEAAEAVQTASLMIRMLDRVEKRLSRSAVS